MDTQLICSHAILAIDKRVQKLINHEIYRNFIYKYLDRKIINFSN